MVFTNSDSAAHTQHSVVHNLSALFLKEFYKKIKAQLTPGLEDTPFVSDLDAGNFIKEARSLYQSKGTEESFRILFNVLYGIDPKIVDLEQFLIKTYGFSEHDAKVKVMQDFDEVKEDFEMKEMK